MNSKKFFHNAALVFGLAAAGAAYAQQTPQMTPEQRDAYRAQRQAEMNDMTPQQRSEMQASRSQGGAQGQRQGTMARDGSGAGGRQGGGGGQGRGR